MKCTLGLSMIAAAVMASAPLYLSSELSAKSYQQDEPTPVVFKSPTVRVLLEHKSKGSLIEVSGRYLVVDPKTNKRLTSGVFGKRSAAKPGEEGLSWGEGFPGVFQFKIVPRATDKIFWVDGIQYKGVLYVYQIGESISLVNELEIEDYVAAIADANCEESTHQEAINAIAICARSDACYHARSKPQAFWHIFAKEVGFRGIGGVTEASKGYIAANLTRGLYLIGPNADSPERLSGLFLSRWTQHSAGHTISYNHLNPEKQERGDFSVACSQAKADRERTQWQATFSKQDLEKLFELPSGSLSDISVVREPISQKVTAIKLKAGDELKTISYFKAVQALGDHKLQSSEFNVLQTQSGQFQFMGYGVGSGVGLCIYSADKMAENGQLAPQILEQFFPGSKVEMINPDTK